MRPYEGCVGGRLLADVGVYSSPSSRVTVEHNGARLEELPAGAPMAPVDPHWSATRGALEALNDAHLPGAALTRADLGRLDEIPVVVLPNVTRMDREEADAIRAYVAGGGRLYASARTSLLPTDGAPQDDFLLADLFGCHFSGEAPEAISYLRPASEPLSSSLGPLAYVAVGEPSELERWYRSGPAPEVLVVVADEDAEVLMTVTLPYGGGRGTRDDQDWASIHSAPPWEDTARPAVVRHRFGAGEVIYSSVDIESAGGRQAGPSRRLFVDLIRLLLGRPPAFEADAHPNAWTTVFHEPEKSRFRLSFLNAPPDSPPLPVPLIRFRLAVPEGHRFTSLRRMPDGEELEFSLDADGGMEAEVRDLALFEMLSAHYGEDV